MNINGFARWDGGRATDEGTAPGKTTMVFQSPEDVMPDLFVRVLSAPVASREVQNGNLSCKAENAIIPRGPQPPASERS